MTTHSSVLGLVILRTEDPGGLQSKGSQRFGHDLTTKQQQPQQTNDYLVRFFFNMVTQAISFQLWVTGSTFFFLRCKVYLRRMQTLSLVKEKKRIDNTFDVFIGRII